MLRSLSPVAVMGGLLFHSCVRASDAVTSPVAEKWGLGCFTTEPPRKLPNIILISLQTILNLPLEAPKLSSSSPPKFSLKLLQFLFFL